jgi:hypothetical protein
MKRSYIAAFWSMLVVPGSKKESILPQMKEGDARKTRR